MIFVELPGIYVSRIYVFIENFLFSNTNLAINGLAEVLEDFWFHFSNSWLLAGAFVHPDATTILYFAHVNWLSITDHFVGQSDRFSYSWAFWELHHNNK